jgi:hypothetical protein
MPGALLSRLPATFKVRMWCSRIHRATCFGVVTPSPTLRLVLPALWHHPSVALPPGVDGSPNQIVPSESRTFRSVRAG